MIEISQLLFLKDLLPSVRLRDCLQNVLKNHFLFFRNKNQFSNFKNTLDKFELKTTF